ncbi:MAG: HAMP domain-containing protein [Planctomycetes bacterium]|nr:HAMP domain-containing protein [Planctomycetota bacterium]
MKWTVGTKIGGGFTIALAILIVIGALSYRSINKLTDTSDWVTHTHQVLEQFSGLLQAMTDCETGVRGYMVADDDKFLEPYRAGMSRAIEHIRQIRELTADNPQQQQRLDVLEQHVNEKLAWFASAIELQKSKGIEASRELGASGVGKKTMDEIRDQIAIMGNAERSLLAVRAEEAAATAAGTRLLIIAGTGCAMTIVIVLAILITRNICNRLREITEAARKVADGDLSGAAIKATEEDEIGDLTAVFNTMRMGLTDLSTQIRQATNNVDSAANEILASTRQQASSTREQAATVQQVSTTMQEITQSGNQISDKAKEVSNSAEATSSSTDEGVRAVKDTVSLMESIRGQVEEVAENIVTLSESTQAVGEIIATVSDIAEQANLLALNAGIEAVSADEHGGRFSVVASEMKNLADQAKQCTVQVRSILSDIQKGINTSVMLTEEAVKRVESGKRQADLTERAIAMMQDSTEQSVVAFQQILGATSQQQVGFEQVAQGMQDIRVAAEQTAVGTSQLEKSAATLTALSKQLQTAVGRYRI